MVKMLDIIEVLSSAPVLNLILIDKTQFHRDILINRIKINSLFIWHICILRVCIFIVKCLVYYVNCTCNNFDIAVIIFRRYRYIVSIYYR